MLFDIHEDDYRNEFANGVVQFKLLVMYTHQSFSYFLSLETIN